LAQGKGSLSPVASKPSSEGLKDELRKAGLLNDDSRHNDDMYAAQHTGTISKQQHPGHETAVTPAVAAQQLQSTVAGGESEDADGDSVLGTAVTSEGPGSGPAAVDAAFDDSDSDDFGLVEQQHLFEAARRRLSEQAAAATQQRAGGSQAEEEDDDEDDPAMRLDQAQQELEAQLKQEEHDDIAPAAHSGQGQTLAALSGVDEAGGTAASMLTRSLDDIDLFGEDISEDISLPLEVRG
jgi:hypothetical protein